MQAWDGEKLLVKFPQGGEKYLVAEGAEKSKPTYLAEAVAKQREGRHLTI